MTFITLEQRFNQVSAQIYNRFAPSGDQLVTVKPNTGGGILGSKSRVKDDSRLLPLVSTARDITRVTRFLASPEGVLFLGKQTLLQTGNVFAETRLYNPAGVIINADPFLGRGSVRHVPVPFSVTGLKTATRDYRGSLQPETVDKFFLPVQGLLGKFTSQLKTTARSPFQININFANRVSAAGYYTRPEDIEFYSRPIDLQWTSSGYTFQEFGTAENLGPRLYRIQPLESRGTVKAQRVPEKDFVNEFKNFGQQKVENTNKTFKQLENSLQTNGYFVGKPLEVLNFGQGINNTLRAVATIEGTNVSYPSMGDPYNGIRGVAATPISTQLGTNEEITQPILAQDTTIYRNIVGDPKEDPIYANSTKTDIIKFIFNTNLRNSEPVHFRAFLSNLKQNLKADFNEQRYLGRTERFVTYGGAKRTVAFEFNIVAFRQFELDQAWARVNYLTGLAFPLGASPSGFMIPPLFKLTVGGIYDEQPCYINTIDFDFLDTEYITFDIDSEVSQVINVKMDVTLLEKRSRYYDSPFYGITEKLNSVNG